MTQRILRTVPLAVLMTTAMAWNLPARAQAATSAPPAASAGPAQQTAPRAAPPASTPVAPAADSTAGDKARLPEGFSQAMAPDKPASAEVTPDPRASKPAPAKP